MTDTNLVRMSDFISRARPVTDRFESRAGIEADRLCETFKDGVDAARTASENYRNLLVESYVGAVQGWMRGGAVMGDQILALLEAETVVDAFRINVDFVQRQIACAPERFGEMLGVKGAEATEGRPAPRG